MSAEIRDRFKNDPNAMIAFLDDVRNRDEAIKLGMVLPLPVVDIGTGEITDGAPK